MATVNILVTKMKKKKVLACSSLCFNNKSRDKFELKGTEVITLTLLSNCSCVSEGAGYAQPK